ncbi:hypothetical protein [Ectobacillus panaciterrae]|nr:hypothetical protein [Ectobacillus panaciterrae]
MKKVNLKVNVFEKVKLFHEVCFSLKYSDMPTEAIDRKNSVSDE